jgi:hypothetical protein
MTVDRPKRDALIATINRFLDGTTTAFQFDDELDAYRGKSADPTISDIARTLWYFYDDCKDHKVNLNQQSWQYIQRLILVLQSDAHIIKKTTKKIHITQLFAGISLLAFCYSIYYLGMGIQYFAIVIPFGLISIILSYFRERLVDRIEQNDTNLLPFSSFSELRALRYKFPQFVRRRYPSGINKQTHGSLTIASAYLNSYVVLIFIAPIILLFQSCRLKISTWQVSSI